MPVNESWGSNTDVGSIAAWLRTKKKVVVTTHVKPDGDAVGSTLAIARSIALAGPAEVQVWYHGPLSPWVQSIAASTPVRRIEGSAPSGFEPDAVVITDTGSWGQLEAIRPWLEQRRAICAVIDHHLAGDADVADRRVVEPGAAAACVPAAELCRSLLGLPSVRNLPRDVAEPLFLGIATDTGWFRHSNVKPDVMRLGADLIEAGVDHSDLFERVEHQDQPARLKLLERALRSLEYVAGGAAAIMVLRRADFDETRAQPTDSTGFSEVPLAVGVVQVSAVLTEAETRQAPLTKMSLRSKPGPSAVDVNELLLPLGGGGHARAAGAKVKLPLPEARLKLIEAIEARMRSG